ncbi:restriction endonuclease subunit S [Jutongia sp. SJQ-6]
MNTGQERINEFVIREKRGRLGMRYEWTKKKLSDIVDFNPRETIKKGTIAKKIPMDVLRPFYRDIPYYVEACFSSGMKFRNGDTIMARITPCLENGKTAQVSILNDGEVGFGSTEYIVFRAKEEIADKDYLYYLVCSPEVRELAIKSMVGSSGRQRVQTDVVKNLEINVPPLVEQEKIGSLLKLFDDKIALNDRINKNLEQQAQTLFDNFYDSLSGQSCILSEIIDIRDGTHDSPKATEHGYPLVTSKHLLPFGVDTSSANIISKADYDKVNERSKVNTGDILISMIGTVGLISYVIDSPVEFAIKNVGLFKTSKHPSLDLYILYYLKNKSTTQHMEKCLAGSTQKYISLGELRKLPIVVPSPDELAAYNLVVRPIVSEIALLVQENRRLSNLRDTLLPKLMSGELDVSGLDI